jgi:ADP-heptose:LPS heptosyltransferase
MKNPITLFVNISAIGDAIGAEPALRYAVTHLFNDISDSILIATIFPEFYTHLTKLNSNVLILHTDIANKNIHLFEENTVYRTNPDPAYPENNIHNFTQTAMHTVDFVSLHLLKIILPPEHRHIILPEPTTEEIRNIETKFHKLKLDVYKTLLLHPGVTWPSRTIPLEWWREFLKEFKGKVCIIGKTSPGQFRPTLNTKYSPGAFNLGSKYPSLLNKLSLRETIVAIALSWGLITNDSSPFHMASAFQKYLFSFATSREWYKLHPYGHLNAYDLTTKFLYPASYWCPLLKGQRVDYFPEGINSLTEVLWKPKEAAEFINNFYNKS